MNWMLFLFDYEKEKDYVNTWIYFDFISESSVLLHYQYVITTHQRNEIIFKLWYRAIPRHAYLLYIIFTIYNYHVFAPLSRVQYSISSRKVSVNSDVARNYLNTYIYNCVHCKHILMVITLYWILAIAI